MYVANLSLYCVKFTCSRIITFRDRSVKVQVSLYGNSVQRAQNFYNEPSYQVLVLGGGGGGGGLSSSTSHDAYKSTAEHFRDSLPSFLDFLCALLSRHFVKRLWAQKSLVLVRSILGGPSQTCSIGFCTS